MFVGNFRPFCSLLYIFKILLFTDYNMDLQINSKIDTQISSNNKAVKYCDNSIANNTSNKSKLNE